MKTLIAGNWKMHMLHDEGVALLDGLLAGLARVPADHEVLVMPPFTLLGMAAERLRGTRVKLGAQNMHWEWSGAFTGEISSPMLRDAGCGYVLVGHSERRALFQESGEVLARKLRAALAAGLLPIYCVGENLAQREAGETEALLRRHFEEALLGLDAESARRVVLAYEPVWAIGTGRTATPAMAQAAHACLRGRLEQEFGASLARAARILYGGSVKPENAAELLAEPDVDGLLVGGASLKAEGFLAIAAAGHPPGGVA
jgi:triosephosphate isomerase